MYLHASYVARALLRSLGARNSWAILWRENLFLVHNWWIFKALEKNWLQLAPLQHCSSVIKESFIYFYKKKPTTPSPRAWRIGGGVRETGEEKVGDASPKRVGSERNERKLCSIANYFAMKKPRKKSREPGLQCTGGGRLPPPPCSVHLPCFINTNCTNSIQHTNWLSAFVFVVTSLTRTAYGRLAQVPGCALDINSYIRLSRSVNTLEYLS